jgi:hypothetical protein
LAARKAGAAAVGVLTGHFSARELTEAGCRAVLRDVAALGEVIASETATGEDAGANRARGVMEASAA